MATSLTRLRMVLERALEAWLVIMIVAMTAVVVLAVIWRKAGASFIWYDEVASILLAWVTYYGAALAAVKRAHIGVPELVRRLRPALRLPLAVFAEACVIAFFVLLAWVGYTVLEVLASDTLVSLPGVSVAYAQSVIPLGALLFVAAELLVLPEVLREAKRA
jgi:TRAP-type C4-dicarboxylate transport system permease small subunit